MALKTGYIQVAPDSTGKLVANVIIRDMDPLAASSTEEYVQLVGLVDAQGQAVDFVTQTVLLERLLAEMRTLRQLFSDWSGMTPRQF